MHHICLHLIWQQPKKIHKMKTFEDEFILWAVSQFSFKKSIFLSKSEVLSSTFFSISLQQRALALANIVSHDAEEEAATRLRICISQIYSTDSQMLHRFSDLLHRLRRELLPKVEVGF